MEDVSARIARLEADKAGFDRWAASLGGVTGRRYMGLYNEAREFAGLGGCMRYLDMCRQLDDDLAAAKRARKAAQQAREAARHTEASSPPCSPRPRKARRPAHDG